MHLPERGVNGDCSVSALNDLESRLQIVSADAIVSELRPARVRWYDSAVALTRLSLQQRCELLVTEADRTLNARCVVCSVKVVRSTASTRIVDPLA